MNNAAWLLLHVGYVLPLMLLAWVITGRNITRSRATLFVLLALPFFYLSHYLVVQHIAGLPSDQPVPDFFTLLGFEINEPNSRTDSAGEILLWLRADGSSSPRVHRLPYARELHESLSDAGERQAAGSTQVGVRRPISESAKTTESRSGESNLEFKNEQPRKPPAKQDS